MTASCVPDTSFVPLRDLTMSLGKDAPLWNLHQQVCRCFPLWIRSRCLVRQKVWRLDICLVPPNRKTRAHKCTNKMPSLQFWLSHETNCFILPHLGRLDPSEGWQWVQTRIVCWPCTLPGMYFMSKFCKTNDSKAPLQVSCVKHEQ